MEKFPLDETLCWGQSEDVEWSYRIRQHYNFSMNVDSSVKLLKLKNNSWREMGQDLLDIFLNMSDEEYDKIIQEANKKYIENFGKGL